MARCGAVLSLVWLAGCDLIEPSGNKPGEKGSELHECAEIEPRILEGSFEGQVSLEDDVEEWTWTAPGGPLRGVAVFRVAAPFGDEHITPAMGVEYAPTYSGAGDIALEVGDEVAVAVAVGADVTLDVFYEDGAYRPEIAYPYPVRMEWSWEQRDDCYEPNDTPEQAKHVPLDTDLSAWMFMSVGDDYPGPEVDFYRFTLEEPARVRVAFSGPDSLAPALDLWSPSNDPEVDFPDHILIGEDGQAVLETPELAAGTWWLRAQPFVSESAWDVPEAPAEPHLWEPYTLRVERR